MKRLLFIAVFLVSAAHPAWGLQAKVSVRGEDLEERYLAHIGDMTDELRRQAGELFGLSSSGTLMIRLQHWEGEPPNRSGGGQNISLIYPSGAQFLSGDAPGYDPVYDYLDMLAMTGWHGRLREWKAFPIALQDALNRYFAKKIKGLLGEGLLLRWPGSAQPREGSLRLLPADHPLVQDRDRLLAVLEKIDQVEGPTFLGDKIAHWKKLRLSSREAYASLVETLTDVVKRVDGEDATLQMFLEPEFQLREDVPSTDASRMKGLRGELKQSSPGLRLWFGEQRSKPTGWMSCKGRTAVMLNKMPEKGNWKFGQLEVLGHCKGNITDEHGYVVVMNQDLQEVLRWAFPLGALAQEGEDPFWVVLRNPEGQWAEGYQYYGIEIPELEASQDVLLGWRPGRTSDHSFLAVPGRSLSSTEESGDYAMIAQFNGLGTDERTPAMLREHLEWANE